MTRAYCEMRGNRRIGALRDRDSAIHLTKTDLNSSHYSKQRRFRNPWLANCSLPNTLLVTVELRRIQNVGTLQCVSPAFGSRQSLDIGTDRFFLDGNRTETTATPQSSFRWADIYILLLIWKTYNAANKHYVRNPTESCTCIIPESTCSLLLLGSEDDKNKMVSII
jgi:hypothetical protein